MERNLMIAGFGGQGVMTMGKLLAEATAQSTDLGVTFFPSYGAAMRGGTANCYVVISDEAIGAPVSNSVEDLIVMNEPSLIKFQPNVKPGGTMYINSSICDRSKITRDDITVYEFPVTEKALEMGDPRILNILMLGFYIGCTNAVPPEVVIAGIHHKFENKPKVIPLNDEAFNIGLEAGKAAAK